MPTQKSLEEFLRRLNVSEEAFLKDERTISLLAEKFDDFAFYRSRDNRLQSVCAAINASSGELKSKLSAISPTDWRSLNEAPSLSDNYSASLPHADITELLGEIEAEVVLVDDAIEFLKRHSLVRLHALNEQEAHLVSYADQLKALRADLNSKRSEVLVKAEIGKSVDFGSWIYCNSVSLPEWIGHFYRARCFGRGGRADNSFWNKTPDTGHLGWLCDFNCHSSIGSCAEHLR